VPRALEEFWSIGLRNPHRFSFDGTTVWGGDIGQDRVEKVFRASRGSNHQWSYREGTLPFARSYLAGVPPKPPVGTETAPAFEYAHTNGNGAVIGGYVYRGVLFPELAGKYVFGDFNSGRIWALEAPNVRTLLTLPADRRLTSFGIDRDRELLLCVFGKPSTILRLARK
jgi:glucose/arabinose dehydrogenase